MEYLSLRNIGIACGVGFLGYCVYFDHKRRSDPAYKEKVKARRELERLQRESEEEIELPPANDQKALEKFFVSEVEKGEELIQAGDYDRAVKHLSYAVVLCPQPQQLLAYMKESLPAPAYLKLVKYLEVANERVNEAFKKSSLAEEDVE